MYPEDWKCSLLVPLYKDKGVPLVCGSYRGIKLLENARKVLERVFGYIIQQQIDKRLAMCRAECQGR